MLLVVSLSCIIQTKRGYCSWDIFKGDISKVFDKLSICSWTVYDHIFYTTTEEAVLVLKFNLICLISQIPRKGRGLSH